MEHVFQFITDRYEPANNFGDADYMPTTNEILEKMRAHTGNEELTAAALFSFLHGQDFKMEELSELHFVWLLKSRPVLSE